MPAVYEIHNNTNSRLAIPLDVEEPSSRDTVHVGPGGSARVTARQLLEIRKTALFQMTVGKGAAKKPGITVMESQAADAAAVELAALKGKPLADALKAETDPALLEEAAVQALEIGNESAAKAIEKRLHELGAVVDAT